MRRDQVGGAASDAGIAHTMQQVYGPTWKELIQEMFGDGIMSAIDFDMTMERQPDPKARMRVLAISPERFVQLTPGCAGRPREDHLLRQVLALQALLAVARTQ